MASGYFLIVVLWFCLSSCDAAFAGTQERLAGFAEAVEADWALQLSVPTNSVSTRSDAAGGCDGKRDGKWGFHTGFAGNPWWQVDLGGSATIDRVVVWNRCDAAGRATRLMALVSDDGNLWQQVYKHDGAVFYGFTDNKPLVIKLQPQRTRFVRIQLPEEQYLHLDEIEVFGPDNPGRNVALGRPADQVGISQWSVAHVLGKDDLCEMDKPAKWKTRRQALSDPLLDFDAILFTKRTPGSYNHMSDQYYGWWSRPGGGIFILRNFKSDAPAVECITQSFKEHGSFLRPMLSFDARRALFSWCRYYPHLAAEPDKMNKANVPEDAFYHIFEMNVDGSNVRQLTRGKYDDIDGRYLPDGRIVFISTRRGHWLQAGRDSAAQTLLKPDLPDIYVRCGGGPQRPVAVYTLHTMNGDGGNMIAISPFEMFEWEPSVANDGTILYSRWDYIDRNNMPYMSLWSVNPDGSSARLVYGNFTKSPHCTFEPRAVPGSNKIIFVGSGHHAQTMGSLVLLDPAVGTEGSDPITRLTPDVPFPEAEGWPVSYYANPWPLSERLYLVSWGAERFVSEGNRRAPNGMGIYLFDAAEGRRELLYRDPDISCMYPIPLKQRGAPPVAADRVNWDGPKEGCFLVADVTRGIDAARTGEVKSLRIVAVPGKTHPVMNHPNIGITRDDPGKCVLGTVPVESDGSAYFRAPAGVIVFFQALDSRGMAVQTMRSVTHVQPGQTVGCIGCHEPRNQTAPAKPTIAARREPSKIAVGPEGSWPFRFDKLVQPVLDRSCVSCHNPAGKNPKAAAVNLAPDKSYETLTAYGNPSLRDQVREGYGRGYSIPGSGLARDSALLAHVLGANGQRNVRLGSGDIGRLIVWLDCYGQKLGSFSEEQERELQELRRKWADLLVE